MGNKKKKSLPPRRLRGSRESRLSWAKVWITKFNGGNIIRGYKNHFGVSWEGAIVELRMLGVKLDEKYVGKVIESVKLHIHHRQLRRIKKENLSIESYQNSDEQLSFIAGYTEGEAPFGMVWGDDENL